MYTRGEQVVYGMHGICSIVDLEEHRVDRKTVEYYVLQPLGQEDARYYVPTQNPAAVAKLRRVLTAEELDALLHSEEARRDAWIPDENQRKLRYRSLITGGDRAALVSMVHSLHRQKQLQAAAGRKFHQCDENFLKDAEKLLTSEFSMVLQMDSRQVGDYVRSILNAE